MFALNNIFITMLTSNDIIARNGRILKGYTNEWMNDWMNNDLFSLLSMITLLEKRERENEKSTNFIVEWLKLWKSTLRVPVGLL